MDASKSPEVTFKYFLPENQDELWLHVQASRMYTLLYEIDQNCRSITKYDSMASVDKIKLAEDIRQMIRSNIDMDRIS
jgi:hypothetical protein